ncbi:MAG: DUF2877 domain-containing protein, partial [Candidatus Bipolaricaulia bacterium]
ATRIGAQARRYLNAIPRSGTVVSAFRGGVNVLLNETDDLALVFVQSGAVPLHPWALAAEAVEHLRVGDVAVAEPDCIHFRSEIVIDFASAQVAELRIAPYTNNEAALAQSRLPLLEKALSEGDGDPFRPRIDEVLEDWKQTCDSEALARLIGLGAGSTPSGDDALVGILAGLTSNASLLGETRLVQLRYAVRKALAALSTPLGSAQMIAAAIDRLFPEPLLDLVTALGHSKTSDVLRQAIDRVVGLGASSGRSMLVGLLASLASS